MMEKPLTLADIFKDYQGENPQQKEIDFGEDVGKERIWTMTDEAYEKEYGGNNKE